MAEPGEASTKAARTAASRLRPLNGVAAMSHSYRIGMIGCGTVGSGVLELLCRRRADLSALLGRDLEVVRIAVRDRERPRHHVYGFVDPDVFTDDLAGVIRGDDIDLVVEVAGGVDAPRDWIVDALRHGKDVVTANKATLAFHGEEIFRVAHEEHRCVYYEASVAAAIPVIEMLQNGLVGNQITRLCGILNGTCNYILTRMEVEGLGYSDALREAQEKGFAEADPTLDVSGGDTAHKLALLARIITNKYVSVHRIHTEGIESITAEDISFAATLGYRVKLLAIAHLTEDHRWDLRVHPALVRREEVLAQVANETNAVQVRGDAAGPMLVYGSGAGSFPTASSVVADVVRAAKGDRPAGGAINGNSPVFATIDEIALRNYVRMTVIDLPGVMGRVTSFLGMRGISISSMQQPEAKHGQPISIVFVTHQVGDRVLTSALDELAEKTSLIHGPTTRIRIED